MMSNFKINTTLAIGPRHDCRDEMNIIVRGSTAVLDIDLANISYLTDNNNDENLDFKQLTVIIKEPNKRILTYNYYIEENNVDVHFNYDSALNKIEFTLSSTETADLQLSDIYAPTQWEVTIITKDDYTVIQKQKPLIVVESLYNESIGQETKPVYVADETLCSSTLICNN